MYRVAASAVLLMFILNAPVWAESSPTAPPATAGAAETPPPAAEPPQPEPAKTAPANSINPAEQALAKSLNDGSRIDWWGPEEAKYLVLWREQSRPKQFGSLVLLHSELHNADWPGVIHTLRTQLPNQGWSTASLSMPQQDAAILSGEKAKAKAEEKPAEPAKPAEATPPAQPENALPTAATEPTPKTEPTPTQTAAPVATPPATETPATADKPKLFSGAERIADAVEHLNTQPGGKVLVVYHLAAESLLRAAREGKLAGYSALVLVEPAFLTQDPTERKLLQEELALLPFAILDISAERGDANAAAWRKAMADRNARKDYVQWRAPGATLDFIATSDLLESRVRGWLHKEFELPRPKPR